MQGHLPESFPERGLENGFGENHCFLNATIQALWNLQTFRDSFTTAPEHCHVSAIQDTKQPHEADSPDAVFGTEDISPEPRIPDADIPDYVIVPLEFDTKTKMGIFWRDNVVSRVTPGSPADQVGVQPGWRCLAVNNQSIEGDTKAAIREAKQEGMLLIHFQLVVQDAAHQQLQPSSSTPEQPASAQPPVSAEASCCYCALKSIFANYRFGDHTVLPPDVLRMALSKSFEKENRFRLGDMEDACETMEALFASFHSGPGDSGRIAEADVLCTPPCVPHQVFGHSVVELRRCSSCSYTADPVTTPSFVLRVYVAEVIDPLRRGVKLAKALRSAFESTDGTNCPRCASKSTMVRERFLVEAPKSFVVSLVWPTRSPKAASTWALVAAVEPFLDPASIFQYDNRMGKLKRMAFRGLVCFGGRHYVATFWNWRQRCWTVFNDKNVSHVADWSELARGTLYRGAMVPTLMFFENIPDDLPKEDLEAFESCMESIKQAPPGAGDGYDCAIS